MTTVANIPKFTFRGRRYGNARVVKIHDGDSMTIAIASPLDGPDHLVRLTLRLLGIDAADMSRADDRISGRAARRALVESLGVPIDDDERYDSEFFDQHDARVDVLCHDFDKYGRCLAEVSAAGSDRPVNLGLCDTYPDLFARWNGNGARPLRRVDGDGDGDE